MARKHISGAAVSRCRITVHLQPDGVEVRFGPGWTPEDLSTIRSIPGRRWEPDRRCWVIPEPDRAIERLEARFGADRIVVLGAPGGTGPSGPTSSGGDGLARVRDALLLRGYSPRTRKAYLGHVRRFLQWTGGGLDGLPADPTALAERYIVELIGSRRASRAYHSQLVSALRFLLETVLGEPRLALAVPRPKAESTLPAVLAPVEVAQILAAPVNLKHRALLMLLYSSGLRVSELVRLRPEDVDAERGLLRVRRGKGAKDRYTLLAERALDVVEMYRAAIPSETWLFPGAREGRHLTSRSVQKIVARAARRAGVPKHVTPHTLRHSFATHLLEGGTNLRIIQELLGHASSRTTERYTHVAKSTFEAVRSPLDNLKNLTETDGGRLRSRRRK